MPLPWSFSKEPKEPKPKEKMIKTGRGGAAGIKPASTYKTGGDALLAPPTVVDRDVIRSPRGREASTSGARASEPKLKTPSKKHRASVVGGDDDGGLVLIGKTGRGGLGNTPGRKARLLFVAAASKLPFVGVRRPTSVTTGLDLLAGDGRYSLRASASLYTLADTDETDMSHHITPFILSDYDASTSSECAASEYTTSEYDGVSISECDASILSSSSSSSCALPATPLMTSSSSASIYSQSSISSAGPPFPPFLSPSASTITIQSQPPPLEGYAKPILLS